MTGSNTIYMPKDVRRDPRTGEAATDPTTSPADDPTHGVDPKADRGATGDPLSMAQPAARGAQIHENASPSRRSNAPLLIVAMVVFLVAIGALVWFVGDVPPAAR